MEFEDPSSQRTDLLYIQLWILTGKGSEKNVGVCGKGQGKEEHNRGDYSLLLHGLLLVPLGSQIAQPPVLAEGSCSSDQDDGYTKNYNRT